MADTQLQSDAPATWFAPAGRALADEVAAQAAWVASHPTVDALLSALGGIVLVLNPQRQVIAVNASVLGDLGLSSSEEVLGLRVGEIFDCRHLPDGPDGCGTSKACRTCGLAIATVACQHHGAPNETECHIVSSDGRHREFRVRADVLHHVEGEHLVITLQDIHAQKQLEDLHRVFFHDLLNTLTVVNGIAGDLDADDTSVERLTNGLARVTEQVRSQRDLDSMEQGQFRTNFVDTRVAGLLADLVRSAEERPSAAGVTLELAPVDPQYSLRTDPVLLRRVLQNMVLNALEASETGQVVRVWAEPSPDGLTVCVRNEATIAEEVALRVFERHHSTKAGTGRGLGTFSMRLIGERYLGGAVDFSTGEDGTVFRIRLPR